MRNIVAKNVHSRILISLGNCLRIKTVFYLTDQPCIGIEALEAYCHFILGSVFGLSIGKLTLSITKRGVIFAV
jgi:hypothetical protein